MIRKIPTKITRIEGSRASGTALLHYVLSGEVACKKNSNRFNRRTGCVYKDSRFIEWHRSALLQIRAQGIPAAPFGLYEARFVLYHGTRRRIDSDNQVTSLLDLLQDARVVADDCWTAVPRKIIEDVYRRGRPGAEVVIVPLTEARA